MDKQNGAGNAGGTILIVDDDTLFGERLRRALAARGHNVLFAKTQSEAITLARRHKPDLSLVDLRLGSESGLDLVREIRAMHKESHIVVVTGYGSITTAVRAVQLGANDYLTKPLDVDRILDCRRRLTACATTKSTSIRTPSLDEVQWDHIHRVLSDCGDNISRAAKRLGLHRRSLQRKLAKRPIRRA